jgi:hypothetical protein
MGLYKGGLIYGCRAYIHGQTFVLVINKSDINKSVINREINNIVLSSDYWAYINWGTANIFGGLIFGWAYIRGGLIFGMM